MGVVQPAARRPTWRVVSTGTERTEVQDRSSPVSAERAAMAGVLASLRGAQEGGGLKMWWEQPRVSARVAQ